MGLDFKGLTAIGSHFSGEMAGGMTQGPDGIQLDMITVLKATAPAETFLEEVYMPWIIGYGESMAAMLEKQLGQKMEPSFVRTADSTLARGPGDGDQIPDAGHARYGPHRGCRAGENDRL